MPSKMPVVRLENAAASISRCRAPARNMGSRLGKDGLVGRMDTGRWAKVLGGVQITELEQSFREVPFHAGRAGRESKYPVPVRQ